MIQDLHFALRTLCNSSGFTLVLVVTLGLRIISIGEWFYGATIVWGY